MILASLPDAEVEVSDMRGTGDHFEIRVVSKAFAGKSLIEQKRASRDLKKDIPLPAEVQKAIKQSAEAAKNTAATTMSTTAVPALNTSPATAADVSPAVAAPTSVPTGSSQAETQTPAEGNA